MERILAQVQDYILNPLHPYLTPITHNLPTPLNDFSLSLLGEQCHSSLLLDLSLTQEPQCVSLAISKVLGIAIITAASIVKVPQIINLVSSQSASGLSFTSYLLETLSFIISLSYNVRNQFPFSTYGETCFILLQDIVISYLILHYTNQTTMGVTFLAVTGALLFAFLGSSTLINTSTLTTFQAFAGVISVASKLPQIITIYQTGGTGQLSAFAVFNYLAGSLSRIYTTLQEVDDKLILYNFIAGFVLNLVLAIQVVYYWNSMTTAKTKTERKTEAIAPGAAQSLNVDTKGTATGVQRPSSRSGRRRGVSQPPASSVPVLFAPSLVDPTMVWAAYRLVRRVTLRVSKRVLSAVRPQKPPPLQLQQQHNVVRSPFSPTLETGVELRRWWSHGEREREKKLERERDGVF